MFCPNKQPKFAIKLYTQSLLETTLKLFRYSLNFTQFNKHE